MAFMDHLKASASAALKRTAPGEGLDPADRANPSAVFDHYIDRVAVDCVNQLTPTWSRRLTVVKAPFDNTGSSHPRYRMREPAGNRHQTLVSPPP
jgi:hypothetical protein